MLFHLCRLNSRKVEVHTSRKFKLSKKYFETVYNSCELHRTIYDATLTLKHKGTKKLSHFKILPYLKDRYAFALKFYFSKLPPLSTCEFGLTFRLPFLDWFICGSLSALNNELKNLVIEYFRLSITWTTIEVISM